MEKYIIPNLRNACRVLKLLASSMRPLSTREIADKLDLPRTSAMRIISTLTVEGFVKKENDRITLGPALISIGSAAKSRLDLGALATPFLKKVTEQTGETCHLAVPSGNRSLIVEVSFSPHPLSSSRGPGALVELHCSATGKCFLAFNGYNNSSLQISESELSKHTGKTITTLQRLDTEVTKVKSTHFALDDEEFFDGVRCIAAPVFDSNSECVAAFGVTASTTRFTTELVTHFANIIKSQANELSQILGWKGQQASA